MHFTASHLASGGRLHAACACASVRKFSPTNTERKYERSRPFQVQHLSLDLDVEFDQKAVSGTASLRIQRRAPSGTELSLDAVGFQLGELVLTETGGRPKRLNEGTDFYYDSDSLTIHLGEDFDTGLLEIEYRAKPRLGLYFLEPDDAVPDRPKQVWSQCQDEDGRHWFPCQDKPHVKMTYDLKARVPNGMTVLSGGELVEKKTPKSGRWEFSYRLDVPTPAYLVTLVAGQFDEWEESITLPSGKVIPLRYLVPPGAIADGKRAFHRTAEAIRLFSEKTGVDYPFDRYTQVVVADFIFGGMENTTATTMYEHILIDKTAALDVESYDLVAHELAHQWFGDLVTCRDWSHAWLNEGFATYFEHVERENRLGLDEYEHNVTVDLNIYLGEARGNYQRPIVCRDYDEPIDLFDRHLYQKGGLVLHMLRRRLGDQCFWKGVENYLQAHRGGIAETNDLMRHLEEVSGLSLEKFFDQWVYRPGHPDIKVKVAYANQLLTIDIEQTQKNKDVATFELPFEVIVHYEDSSETLNRLIDEKKSSIVLRTTKRPSFVTVDPNYSIAAPIVLEAPADLLRNMLRRGKRARTRRMAAYALGKRHDPDTVEALISCLENTDELWMVRTKAAESLGQIRGEQAEAALLAAVNAPDHKVRKAVTSALGELRTPRAREALTKLAKDKSYLVTAAAARSLANYKTEATTKLLTGLLQKDSWSEVVRAGALAALAESGDDAAEQILMDWSNYGRPLRARRAAIAALPKLGEGKKVRDHLCDMLSDRDPHVRMAVLSSLGTLGDDKARSAIETLLAHELDGGVRTRAREILADLGKAGAQGIKEAKEENQRLKRELDDLKLRLGRIEQRLDGKGSHGGAPSSPPRAKGPKKKAAKKAAPTKAAKKASSRKKSVKKRTSRTS